jgi:hypothetical protein
VLRPVIEATARGQKTGVSRARAIRTRMRCCCCGECARGWISRVDHGPTFEACAIHVAGWMPLEPSAAGDLQREPGAGFVPDKLHSGSWKRLSAWTQLP